MRVKTPEMETPSRTGDPWRQLMAAVLVQAIRDLTPTASDVVRGSNDYVGDQAQRRRLLTEETKMWFDSKDDEPAISFENVCRTLDLCPRTIRNILFGQERAQEIRTQIMGRIRFRNRPKNYWVEKIKQAQIGEQVLFDNYKDFACYAQAGRREGYEVDLEQARGRYSVVLKKRKSA